MKVLLVTLNAKFIHSSLALAYLKAFAQSESINIEIREYTINEQVMDILADIHKAKPDILCFSCYIWNIEPILEICSDFKRVNPDIPIILGGPEVSYDAKDILAKYPVDFVIRGEGEETFKELLLSLKNKSGYSFIKGITYRHEDKIIENEDRELINNLDIIPFPYQDNLANYKNKTVYYETSRGCPFNCAYCLSSTIKGVRYFSLDRVKEDLSYLMANEVKEVKFVDRTFNCNEERALKIMDFILENNKSTKFHFEIDAEILSDKFIDFLRHVPSGWFDFEIGIQSTYLPALNAVNRKAHWETLQRKIKLLTELGNIHIHLDLIAGLPNESYSEFGNSFNNVYNLKPDMLQLGFLKLLKGSPIRKEAERYQYVYQGKPPYQVLSNHIITYDEMIRLNQIENLVNRYYNTHIIEETLNYIIEKIFADNAFRFFEEFAKYWDKEGLFYLGHKRDREYSIVKEFID
ncbi:MAG: B12-binding domain-containing radical SAM protein, partial [Syntrophomonadaceae bacterium]|nr:B12-binding domain-containing radical SAM protein [Syntrophomonadaceae bacterium]